MICPSNQHQLGCCNHQKSTQNVAEKMFVKPRTCSSQRFDISLKLLLFVTKFYRAKLTVFAFSDYNFAKDLNNLRSLDFSLLGCMATASLCFEFSCVSSGFQSKKMFPHRLHEWVLRSKLWHLPPALASISLASCLLIFLSSYHLIFYLVIFLSS